MSVVQAETQSVDELLATLKSLPALELFKVMKAVLSETEKKVKHAKTTTDKPTKKKGSMPSGQVPPQLKKPRAWVEFTLKHALENGWESFVVVQKTKDKETKEVTEEEIEMPASILHNGTHVYEDSVTEKTPNGKQMIQKEAMSLSRQRKESGHATYAEFEAQYVAEQDSDDDKSALTTSTKSSKVTVRKTAAEKEAEKEAKKAEKEAAAAAKKAEKEAEKAAKEAEKEAEKVRKALEKEAEKLAKEAEKAARAAEKKKGATSDSESVPAAAKAPAKKKIVVAK